MTFFHYFCSPTTMGDDDHSIRPETTPPSHDFLWWTIGVAALLGYLLPQLIARFSNKKNDPKNKKGRPEESISRQSRLLQHKFGSLMEENGQHDLQLSAEDETTHRSSSTMGAAAAVVVVPVVMLSEDVVSSSSVSSSGDGAEEESPPAPAPAGNHMDEQRPVIATSAVKASKKSQVSAAARRRVERPSPPPFQNTSDRHPGLTAFHYWWDVQTSLYRIYTLTRADPMGPPSDPPPYNPSSRRGKTSVDLRVTNDTDTTIINVYWINYTGGHELKGSIAPGGDIWTQSTWIDHPWVFCDASSSQKPEPVIAHYIPYKIIPNVVPEAPTIDLTETTNVAAAANDDDAPTGKKRLIGIHRFAIVKLSEESSDNYKDDDRRRDYTHWIRDDILPLSPDIGTEQQALELCLLHCVRTGYYHWKTLLLYYTKIQQHPENATYRHIRIANRTFADTVWNTAARGVFLASGWVEHGAYLEWGVADRPFPRLDDVHRIIQTIERWWQRAENDGSDDSAEQQQPEGADGYGRAGFQ
jgi:PUB domain